MTTITVWLLFSLGSYTRPHILLEKFPTQAECNRVATALRGTGISPVPAFCIEATVVKTW